MRFADTVAGATRIADSISEQTGRLLGWLVLAMTATLCWEVLMRGVFDRPTIWVHEGSQYIFAVYFALGGAYALKNGSFIAVDVWTHRLTARARAFVNVATSAFAFLFLAVLLWKGSSLAIRSVEIAETSGTTWNPPVYPFKIAVVLGTALLAMQTIAVFLRDVVLASSGKEVQQ